LEVILACSYSLKKRGYDTL
jgi:hypothetical protein